MTDRAGWTFCGARPLCAISGGRYLSGFGSTDESAQLACRSPTAANLASFRSPLDSESETDSRIRTAIMPVGTENIVRGAIT